jgi:hypothetical protein
LLIVKIQYLLIHMLMREIFLEDKIIYNNVVFTKNTQKKLCKIILELIKNRKRVKLFYKDSYFPFILEGDGDNVGEIVS